MMLDEVRNVISGYVYGHQVVMCEDCGAEMRPGRAVWRGEHPYCCAAQEAADAA
jgi:hypothetical protein